MKRSSSKKERKETRLEYLLTHSHKTVLTDYLGSHPRDFNEALRLALSDDPPYSWRAAWVIWSCMKPNDPRIKRYISRIVDTLPSKNQSQQRELMMILQRMELSEKEEGKLFNFCISAWKNSTNQPSIRYNAFKLILKIGARHPGLRTEIGLLTGGDTLDTLSKGVRHSVIKLTHGGKMKKDREV